MGINSLMKNNNYTTCFFETFLQIITIGIT